MSAPTKETEAQAEARHRGLPGGRTLCSGHRIYWWAEILAIIAFYVVYSAIRNANEGGRMQAFRNAERIIDLQRVLGIYHEATVQDWALHFKPLVVAANYFYGSLHFVVTIAAGVVLYRWFSDAYPRYRNTIAITTALALVGFVTFPLMPPRLLDTVDASYTFVDTLAKYPTFWSFDSGAISAISNQYAAMPSVHVAWATWCALVFTPRAKTAWVRALAVAYPVLTVVVIVITGNHYVLDAVGGLLVLALGWVIAGWVTRAGRARAPAPARA